MDDTEPFNFVPEMGRTNRLLGQLRYKVSGKLQEIFVEIVQGDSKPDK